MGTALAKFFQYSAMGQKMKLIMRMRVANPYSTERIKRMYIAKPCSTEQIIRMPVANPYSTDW